MKIKRVIAVMLTVALLFAFAACNKNQGEGEDTTAATLGPPQENWGGVAEDAEGNVTGNVLTSDIMKDAVETAVGAELRTNNGADYVWDGKLTSLSEEQQTKVEAELIKRGFAVSIADGKLVYEDTETTVPAAPDDSVVAQAVKEVVGEDYTWDGKLSSLDDEQLNKVKEQISKDTNKKVEVVDNKIVYATEPSTTVAGTSASAGTTTASGSTTVAGETTTKAPSVPTTASTNEPTTTVNVTNEFREDPTELTGAEKLTGIKRTSLGVDTYGGTSNDRFIDVVATSDGGYAVAAEVSSKDGDYASISNPSGTHIAVIIKFDKDGKELWKQAYCGKRDGVKLYAITELTDGSIVAVGDSNETVINGQSIPGKGSDLDGIIIKVSAAGVPQWFKRIGGSSGEYFSSVAATPDGAFIVGGKVTSSDGDFNGLSYGLIYAVVMRYTSDGEMYWRWAKGGSMHNIISSIAVNGKGQIFAACNTKSRNGDFANIPGIGTGGGDGIVFKLDINGKDIWHSIFAGNAEDTIEGIACTDDGGCVVAGYYATRAYASGTFTDYYNYGKLDGAVVKYNSDGSIAFLKQLRGTETETLTDVIVVDGGYIVSGYSRSDSIDLQTIGNKGKSDGLIWLIGNDKETVRIASVAGSQRDEPYALASNGTTVMMIGATMSSDGDFADKTPAGADGRFTSFMVAYDILHTTVSTVQ